MQYRIEGTGTHNTAGHAFLVVSFWHDIVFGPPDLVNDFLIGVTKLPSNQKHIQDSRGFRKTQAGKWTMGWQLQNNEWTQIEDPNDNWLMRDITNINGYVQDIIEEWYWNEGHLKSGSMVDPRLPAQCGPAKGMHAPIKGLENKVNNGIGRARPTKIS